MQKAIKFNLKKGMKDGVLLKALQGKISGETRQEIQQFMCRSTENETTHEILLVEDKYAIILKRELKNIVIPMMPPQRKEIHNTSTRVFSPVLPKICKETTYTIEKTEPMNEYYLAGINDEGYYFIHPLEGFEAHFIAQNRFPTMKEVLAWVNREDEGYFGRIQGDMVYKYVHINENYYGTSPMFCKVILGRHTITADRIIFNNRTKTVIVDNDQSDGALSQVVIHHPEHGVKTIDLPRHHQLIITGQRGRDIEIDESKGVASSGFD